MPNLKTKKTDTNYAIELGKRAAIPWVITAECPKCSRLSSYDLNQGDSIFLHAEAPFELDLCCYGDDDDGCEHEWQENIFIELSVRPATEEELKEWA